MKLVGGSRREAREQVLSLLYEAEVKNIPVSEALAKRKSAVDDYASEAVRGISQRGDEVDTLITRHAKHWALDRMPATDRALLRLAVWELLARHDVPAGVVLAEAVELAKRYSTEDSSRFVNGLLASVDREVRA